MGELMRRAQHFDAINRIHKQTIDQLKIIGTFKLADVIPEHRHNLLELVKFLDATIKVTAEMLAVSESEENPEN